MYAEQCVAELLRTGLATPEIIVGCSEAEIEEVELAQTVRLPQTYRQWLRLAGKCAGVFELSTSGFYPELLTLKEDALCLLRTVEKGRVRLPHNVFVCGMASPEEFIFFPCDGDYDDPSLTIYHVD
jgi:hypothetical protein